MKKFLIFLLILFAHHYSNGQLREFYNNNGQLIADTTFRLSDTNNIPYYTGPYKWNLAYQLIQHANYPTLWMESGIAGLVIAKVTIKKDQEIKHSNNIGKAIKIELCKTLSSDSNLVLSYFEGLYSGQFFFPMECEINTNY